MESDRLRAFVSGTQEDLQSERDAVADALGALGVRVVRAESWGASWSSPRETLREMVGVADVYVGVYGSRYGYVVRPDDISATEFEFREAKRLGKPIIVYVKQLHHGDERDGRQAAFLDEVLDFNQGLFRRPEFADPDQLASWVREDVADLVAHLVRSNSPRRGPFNVPSDIVNFVGRERELDRIHAHLSDHFSPAPVAVYGMSGVGKTALAIRYAHQYRDEQPGGVFWIDLGRSTIGTVLFEVAQSYGEAYRFEAIQDDARQLVFVRSLLSAHRPLMILDDPHDESVLDLILQTAPGCPIIVTTRQRALPSLVDALEVELGGLEGESALTVLDAALGSGRVSKEREAADEICDLVGGLPLGLRVVGKRAALSRLLLSQIAVRMRDRKLDPLRYGTYSTKETNLQVGFDISFDLLPPDHVSVFGSLGVFDGIDFDSQAAAYVADLSAGATTDYLEALHEASLLESGRDSRWRLHPLLRTYAAQRSPSGAAERMIAFFRALAEEAAPRLEGPDDVSWARKMHTEYENILGALRRSIDEGLTADACAIAGVMFWFWSRTGRLKEGAEWLDQVLAMPNVRAHESASAALFAAGALAWCHGRHTEASTLLRESAARDRSKRRRHGLAYSLTFLSLVESSLGNGRKARELEREALSLWRAEGDLGGFVYSLSYLGWAADCRGEWETARKMFDEALAIACKTGHRRSVAWSLIGQGRGEQRLQRLRSARSLFEQAIDVSRQIGDDWSLAWALAGLGGTLVRSGVTKDGSAALEKARAICLDLGDRWGSSFALCGLGRLRQLSGSYAEAAQRFLDAVEHSSSTGDILLTVEGLVGLARSVSFLGHPTLASQVCSVSRVLCTEAAVSLPPDLKADIADFDLASTSPAEKSTALGTAPNLAETLQMVRQVVD
jgi:tetratricopeptide (TPR) repeat protein